MYRPNVCCIIFNEHQEVLGCRRIRSSRVQFVQGGVERRDKNILTAGLREIEEEVGLQEKDLVFVAELEPPSGNTEEFRYILSARANLRRYGYVGQQQRALLFYAPSEIIDKVTLVPSSAMHAAGALQEFESAKWMSFEDVIINAPPEKTEIFKKFASLAIPLMDVYTSK